MNAPTSPNGANCDTYFVDMDYCIRSTVLLTENFSFYDSQNGGVICRDFMRKHIAELGVRCNHM